MLTLSLHRKKEREGGKKGGKKGGKEEEREKNLVFKRHHLLTDWRKYCKFSFDKELIIVILR